MRLPTHLTRGFVASLLFPFAASVWAQDSVKIGIVDIQKAVRESEAGKKTWEKFRSELKEVEAELLKEKRKLEHLKSDLNKKAPLLRDEERRELEVELRRNYREYMYRLSDSKEDLRQSEAEIKARILKGLRKVVAQYGKKKDLTLILERPQVLYRDESIDITDGVIELWNARTREKASQTN